VALPVCRRCGRGITDAPGFLDVETSIEAAPTVLDSAEQYNEFVRNIILWRHLQNLPTDDLRSDYMATLTEQSSHDDPPIYAGLLAAEFCGAECRSAG